MQATVVGLRVDAWHQLQGKYQQVHSAISSADEMKFVAAVCCAQTSPDASSAVVRQSNRRLRYESSLLPAQPICPRHHAVLSEDHQAPPAGSADYQAAACTHCNKGIIVDTPTEMSTLRQCSGSAVMPLVTRFTVSPP